MKMARASEADLNMAMELSSALDLLGQRFLPAMPESIERLSEDDEYERFDRDDDEQCGRAMRHLLDVADRASLMRVVWGAVVMLDPRNELTNPASDVIEEHPRFSKELKQSEALQAAATYALEVMNGNRGKQARLRAIQRLQEAIGAKGGAA